MPLWSHVLASDNYHHHHSLTPNADGYYNSPGLPFGNYDGSSPGVSHMIPQYPYTASDVRSGTDHPAYLTSLWSSPSAPELCIKSSTAAPDMASQLTSPTSVHSPPSNIKTESNYLESASPNDSMDFLSPPFLSSTTQTGAIDSQNNASSILTALSPGPGFETSQIMDHVVDSPTFMPSSPGYYHSPFRNRQQMHWNLTAHDASLDVGGVIRDWSALPGDAQPNLTTPPTPSHCIPLEHSTSLPEDGAIEYSSLSELEAEGEILLGLGLYDGPVSVKSPPFSLPFDDYCTLGTPRFSGPVCTRGESASKGKGLKLEETWYPPSDMEDDDDDEDDDQLDEAQTLRNVAYDHDADIDADGEDEDPIAPVPNMVYYTSRDSSHPTSKVEPRENSYETWI